MSPLDFPDQEVVMERIQVTPMVKLVRKRYGDKLVVVHEAPDVRSITTSDRIEVIKLADVAVLLARVLQASLAGFHRRKPGRPKVPRSLGGSVRQLFKGSRHVSVKLEGDRFGVLAFHHVRGTSGWSADPKRTKWVKASAPDVELVRVICDEFADLGDRKMAALARTLEEAPAKKRDAKRPMRDRDATARLSRPRRRSGASPAKRRGSGTG